MTADLHPALPAVSRALPDLAACPPCDDEQQRAVVIGLVLAAGMEEMGMTERIVASPRYERHENCDPLYDGPLCPQCYFEVDVIGVDTVVQGGGTETTATALRCPCGWGFVFNPPGLARRPAVRGAGAAP